MLRENKEVLSGVGSLLEHTNKASKNPRGKFNIQRSIYLHLPRAGRRHSEGNVTGVDNYGETWCGEGRNSPHEGIRVGREMISWRT